MIYVEVLVSENLPYNLWYHSEDVKINPQDLVSIHLRNKNTWGMVISTSSKKPNFATKVIQQKILFHPPAYWWSMLQWVSEYYYCSLSQTLMISISKIGIKVLTNKTKTKPFISNINKLQIPPPLTEEQSLKIQIMNSRGNEFNVFLLKGVTGSGKTRIYLEMILKVLKEKKSVLFLLPEIAIVQQTISYIEKFSPCPVICIHSSESITKVKQAWKLIFEKKTVILFGVRSACLAPLDNIGLVIVDEEHDSSYKQSEKVPRYNAKNTVLYRSKQWNCPIILGSATPSLESYFLAHNKKYQLIELKKRFNQNPLPEIKIIDMKEQLELQGNEPLSIPLRDALQDTLNKKEQAILLLNRRGYARKRLCQKCGKIEECPNCLCPLIPHKKHQKVICHHCLYQQDLSFACLSCKHTEYLETGLAIEKLEEKLKIYFPNKQIARLDTDTANTQKNLEAILDRVKDRTTDILIGTQMVAKSHDFSHVSLVGVIDADSGLGVPDFRRYENTFQLLTQVAGRAGRHQKKGIVYIQTFQPNQSLFKLIQNQNFDLFYKEELEKRKLLSYPPFRRLFKIEFSGYKEDLVWKEINNFQHILKIYAQKSTIPLLGPGFATLKKKHRKYRCQIFGKSSHINRTKWVLQNSLKDYHKPNTIQINIDIDVISII